MDRAVCAADIAKEAVERKRDMFERWRRRREMGEESGARRLNKRRTVE